MKKILGQVITVAILLMPQQILASPVAPALCSKYKDGCVLAKTMAINGVTVYKWIVCETGVATLATSNGNLYKPRKILQDPENPGKTWEPGNEAVVTSKERCEAIARKYKKKLVKVVEEINPITGGKQYVCKFK